MTLDPGFGVYVHWPFCAAKCPYCDFNSHVRHEPVNEERFAAAFAREISYFHALSPRRPVGSVFFGGGTPSLMKPSTVATILDAIAKAWGLDAKAEITLEANPSSVEAGRFAGYRAAGINRVSLGVQSFDDEELKRLGRLHNAEEAIKAIGIAQSTFERSSFDLIYARPNQTPEMWRGELSEALKRAGEHLSLYQLTIEEGTPYHALHAAGKLVLPDEATARALWDVTQEVTTAAGLPAYEISNHARPGAESRHNLVYWRSGEWAGIGPGAHSRIGMNDGRHAFSTERNPEMWAARVEQTGHGVIVDELLDTVEVADEYLLMGLRLSEGIDVERFERLAGYRLDPERIADLEKHGLVTRPSPGRITVTVEGFPVLDAVVADLAA
ncbi:coproporphyrinogen III oxidase [Terrihabitans soli]|uniref:Heme chaperone HemW n=1 Tax=Terrihabitans soli TaxID=708113 RepID=A0A6S6QZP1_9HYPH|nr:radical SAM family heme chaperone HemW [Terrihabitans soli]BCJ92148.1 coproporphyrinogen III oxidase [Terrihabitans soli]